MNILNTNPYINGPVMAGSYKPTEEEIAQKEKAELNIEKHTTVKKQLGF